MKDNEYTFVQEYNHQGMVLYSRDKYEEEEGYNKED